jgi:stage V sporulation protein B
VAALEFVQAFFRAANFSPDLSAPSLATSIGFTGERAQIDLTYRSAAREPARVSGVVVTEEPLKKTEDVSRQAGRGGLAVAAAKIYFIGVGLVQQIALPRVLGLDGYGALASALSIASITYNPIVTTSIQGVSRAVASAPEERVPDILRRALRVHVVAALLLAVFFFVLAPVIGNAIGAPHIVPALRILSAVMLAYGIYAPLVGALNGRRRFLHQAGFDIVAGTLRTLGLIGGAYVAVRATGSRLAGVDGAMWGFVAGASVILAGALWVVGIGRQSAFGPTAREHLTFIGPLLLGQALLNLLFQADLTMLRLFASEAAAASSLAPTAADAYVGAYRATQLFSFLPYQLLIAVTFVLFPMLASARHATDKSAIKSYVEHGLRLALLVAGAMVSVTAGLSGPLLRLVFGVEAERHGTLSLQVLSVGFGAFAIFGLLTAVLTGLGRERASLAVTAVAFALVVGACFGYVRGTPLSDTLLLRTALSTSAGIVLATIGAGILVFRTAGGLVRPIVAVRVALATLAAAVVGRFFPTGHVLMVLPAAAVVGSVYVVALLVSRELAAADLEIARRVLRRRA